MRLLTSSACVAVVVAAGSVMATDCDLTTLTQVAFTPEYKGCVSDSGYSLESALATSSIEPPTIAQMNKMCLSSSCLTLLDTVEALGLKDCTIESVALQSDIIDVVRSKCEESGLTPVDDTGSSRSNGSSGSGGGPGGATLSMGVIIALACGGFVMLLILVGLCLVWRKLQGPKATEAAPVALPAYPPPVYNPRYAPRPSTPPLSDDRPFHAVVDINPQRYNTPSTAASSEFGRASSSQHSRPNPSKLKGGNSLSNNLWDDPVIVAARIPFSGIQLIDSLSHGGNGEVYRGVYREQYVAVKMLLSATRKDMAHINAFLSEIRLAAVLEHPSIVKFVGVAWESLSDLYSVSEFMEGGDLRTLLTEYKRDGRPCGLDGAKLRIAMQVAHALTYMHSLQPMVLHRDLKSRNILLTAQLEAKLTDFGASKVRLDRTLTAGVGTSLWMAPEVVMGEKYDEKADMFSFGVVLSELDTHELPYEKTRAQAGGEQQLPDLAVMQLVLLGKLQLEFSSGFPESLRAVAASCVHVDPAQRPAAAEVAYKLSTELKTGRY